MVSLEITRHVLENVNTFALSVVVYTRRVGIMLVIIYQKNVNFIYANIQHHSEIIKEGMQWQLVHN